MLLQQPVPLPFPRASRPFSVQSQSQVASTLLRELVLSLLSKKLSRVAQLAEVLASQEPKLLKLVWRTRMLQLSSQLQALDSRQMTMPLKSSVQLLWVRLCLM